MAIVGRLNTHWVFYYLKHSRVGNGQRHGNGTGSEHYGRVDDVGE
jgi:hypothetical protein